MKTLAALIAFVGSIALGIAASYSSGRYAGLAGKAFDNWMVAGFVLSIAIGCWLGWKVSRPGPAPPPPPSEFEVKIAALREDLKGRPDLAHYAPLVGKDYSLETIADVEEREAGVLQLRADPALAKYAERAFRGEYFADEVLQYWKHPDVPILCEHLRALEQDIRVANPQTKPLDSRTLFTSSNLQFAQLQSRYSLQAFVTFEVEAILPGRGSDYYQGHQWLRCTRCQCTIQGWESGAPFPAP